MSPDVGAYKLGLTLGLEQYGRRVLRVLTSANYNNNFIYSISIFGEIDVKHNEIGVWKQIQQNANKYKTEYPKLLNLKQKQ